jgi:hypothetical protein
MATGTSDSRQWLLAAEAAAIAELSMRTIMRLGKAGLIGVRRIPGTRPAYRRSDVERLSSDYFFPATRTSFGGGSPAQEEQRHAAS